MAYKINKLLERNCMEYAKYTIQDRAIVDVRDGLKPIHRRIIWSMYQDRLLWNKNRTKSANACGSVMKFSPHGDSYPAVVRLANDSVLNPLIDGKGAFSSCTSRDVPAGASRYCVVGDTLIPTNKGLIKIRELIQSEENTTNDIDITIFSENNKINKASKYFNCGKHKVREVVTKKGFSIKGSLNHPLLTLSFTDNGENSDLFYQWKTLEEITTDDIVVLQNNSNNLLEIEDKISINTARMLGLMTAKGFVCENEIKNDEYNRCVYKLGFMHHNNDLINEFKEYFEELYPEIELKLYNIKNKEKATMICLYNKDTYKHFTKKYNFNDNSINREIPKVILESSKEVQKEFLKYLFECDGTITINDKFKKYGIQYFSSSLKLIKQLQILLYNSFGIQMGIETSTKTKGYTLTTVSKKSIENFYNNIKFVSNEKNEKLEEMMIKQNEFQIQNNKNLPLEEFIPFLSKYIPKVAVKNKSKFQNISNRDKLINNYKLLKESIPLNKFLIIDNLLNNNYTFLKVKEINDFDEEETVYSIRVDSDCHSFVGNCFINHNTEVRLTKLACSLLDNVNKENIDFKNNYDNTRKEPTVLPTQFPLVLCNPNIGIAVGVASSIPSFNLNEVIDNTIKFINDEELDILYPDFSTYGTVIKDETVAKEVFNNGIGSFKLRATYEINDDSIIIKSIPYTTTREAIIEKVIDLIRIGKIKEIIDINDFTGVQGLEISIEVKKNVNKDELMEKLYKLTTLEDTFSCNFTVLSNNFPQTLGIKEIIKKWYEFRVETIKRELEYDINELKNNINILEGLEKIINDIDNVIKIIRSSKNEKEVIEKLKITYSLNKNQLEYIIKVKLINFNKNWLLEKLKLKEEFSNKLIHNQMVYNSNTSINQIIIKQLEKIKQEYGQERKTKIIDKPNEIKITKNDEIENYACFVTITQEGYIKKMSKVVPSNSVKVKDNDKVIKIYQTNNKATILIFTNQQNCYKVLLNDIPKSIPSGDLGTFLPKYINQGEEIVSVQIIDNYMGHLINVYENNTLAKISLKSFETKQKQSKLKNSLHTDKLIKQFVISQDVDLICVSSINKVLVVNTNEFSAKSTRNSNGQLLIKPKDNSIIKDIILVENVDDCINNKKYEFEDINYYKGKRASIGNFLKKCDKINKGE